MLRLLLPLLESVLTTALGCDEFRAMMSENELAFLRVMRERFDVKCKAERW